MDPGTAAAARLVLTLHASWADDARALLLFRDGSWMWPEIVAHPDLQDSAGLPSLLHRAVGQLRASFDLAPHTVLYELARSYGPELLGGSSVSIAYHPHVDAADGVVVPFIGADAHWLSLEEVLDLAQDPRPGILAFARLASVGARCWDRARADSASALRTSRRTPSPVPSFHGSSHGDPREATGGAQPDLAPDATHRAAPLGPPGLSALPVRGGGAQPRPHSFEWYCPLCHVSANSASSFRAHLLGRSHLRRSATVLDSTHRCVSPH